MTHSQNATLKELYHQFQNGKSPYLLPFSSMGTNIPEALNAINTLEQDGYIEVLSRAIGSALIRLTDDGISLCTQAYG